MKSLCECSIAVDPNQQIEAYEENGLVVGKIFKFNE